MNDKYRKIAEQVKKIGAWSKYLSSILVWVSDSISNFPQDESPTHRKNDRSA